MGGFRLKALVPFVFITTLLMVPIRASAAGPTIQLRYWPANNTGTYGPFVIPYNSWLGGITLRNGFHGDAWAWSFNFDYGPSTFPDLGPGQFTQSWNINLHRQFITPSGRFSLYAGWNSLSFEAPNNPGAAPLYQRQQSLQLGVDGRLRLSEGWYLTADFAFRPEATADFNNVFSPGLSQVQTQSTDIRAGVARSLGTWEAEIGYRWLRWNYTPGPNSCASSPCGDTWAGWYLGFNFSAP